jgi:N6-L-threonylcarbamoyladenine synthase
MAYPAGVEMARTADTGNPKAIDFPRALWEKDSVEFSFSGLKSSVARYLRENPSALDISMRPDICASIQAAIVDVLVRKSKAALRQTGFSTLAVVGGVAANACLRRELQKAIPYCQLVFPEPRFCGDNGVMVAAAAQNRHRLGRWPTGVAAKPGLAWNEDD